MQHFLNADSRNSNEEEEYTVEKVHKVRLDEEGTEGLVSWVGYKEWTWEWLPDVSGTEACKEFLQSYMVRIF
jgi:hypothetical protein